MAFVAAIVALFFLPFSGVGLARFKFLFFDEFAQWAATDPWQKNLSMLSIGGILKAGGFTRLVLPLQVAGLLLMGLFYRLSRDRSFRGFAGLTVFAYAYFIWLSGYIASYYWFFPLLLLSTLWLIEVPDAESPVSSLVSAQSGGIASTAGAGDLRKIGVSTGIKEL